MRTSITSVRLPRVHRAWWILAAAAVTITAAGAFSTMPGLLVDPLQHEFNWSRGSIGVAMWVNMAINGLVAPFAASLMDRFGMRRVAIAALVLLTAGAASTTVMTGVWQLTLYWGFMIGLGTGALAMIFAATVTNRWFVRRRGLAVGILTAASVFGQFVFMPGLASIIEAYQWRAGVVTVALFAVVAAPLVWLLVREHPADVGLAPYGGASTPRPAPVPGSARRALQVLGQAARHRNFWLLSATFAICGVSTNGVMWEHFVPAAGDKGMSPTMASSLITLIGVFNVVGTLVSGWLSDRYDPRVLLAFYYGMRALTLLALPKLLGPQMSWPLIFTIITFGLLDVATVPPTIGLSTIRNTFGTADSAIVFGWAVAAHQIGAGVMAFAGGVMRDTFGTYTGVWVTAGLLSVAAAGMALTIRGPARRAHDTPEAPEEPSSTQLAA